MADEKYPFGKKIIEDVLLLGANEEYKFEIAKLSQEYGFPINNGDILDGKQQIAFMRKGNMLELIEKFLVVIKKYGPAHLFNLYFQNLFEQDFVARVMRDEKVKLNSEEFLKNILS